MPILIEQTIVTLNTHSRREPSFFTNLRSILTYRWFEIQAARTRWLVTQRLRLLYLGKIGRSRKERKKHDPFRRPSRSSLSMEQNTHGRMGCGARSHTWDDDHSGTVSSKRLRIFVFLLCKSVS